jgi:hypothetical protein
MGSYYELRVGGYSVLSDKWPIPQEILSIFVEADKVHSQSAPDLPSVSANMSEQEAFVGYCSKARSISDRLDVMGFTPDLSKAQFSVLLKGEIEQSILVAREWSERSAKDPVYERLDTDAKVRISFLSEFSFEKWLDAIRRITRDRVRWKSFESGKSIYSRVLDPVEAHILNAEPGTDYLPLGFYCTDLRFLIRAFLLCSAPTENVVLDYTDIVDAGYLDPTDQIAANARMAIAAEARAVEKILVLTEGTSDSRILQATCNALYPHLTEFLSFLDHDQFSVAGGASNVLNLLRGFVGAGVSNRVLALFDNDAAGSVQMAKAKLMSLPPNFRVLQLPHLQLAEIYPTLGPTGLIETDINGSACSIELYLGKPALTEQSAGLMPVQWTGYERSLSRYQGELIDKRTVQHRYIEALHRGCADTTNLELVFSQILNAFRD